jgi:glycosyltransferase involved in cell wall biosynthesis
MRPPAPLVFRGDSHLLGQSRPNWRKRWILRWLYQRFAALTYVGQANRDYFRAFGVPDRKLFFAPHAVDATLYKATDQIRTQAKHLRTELRLGDRMVILFAGKFIPAKQPRELLEAFVALAPDNTALVFSGDGAEKTALVDLAAKNPSCFVRFLPFANQSEMPARYAMADLFVLPSRGFYETWGLAVNEAMHMGIPCLVSDRVGCQRDLVTDGETGWVFPVDDPQGLQRCLTRALAELTRHPKAMSGAIARRIAEYSYARATQGLVQTLQSIPR